MSASLAQWSGVRLQSGPEFDSRFPWGSFSRSSHTTDLKIGARSIPPPSSLSLSFSPPPASLGVCTCLSACLPPPSPPPPGAMLTSSKQTARSNRLGAAARRTPCKIDHPGYSASAIDLKPMILPLAVGRFTVRHHATVSQARVCSHTCTVLPH